MKIALDISPLLNSSSHKGRGAGRYIELLRKNLPVYDRENEYIFFNNREEIPSDIDVVHYPYFDPFFLTLKIEESFKTVVTVHDLIPLVFKEHFPSGIRGLIKWEIQKRKLRSVNAVLTDSECSKKDIGKIAGISEEKIYNVPLAVSKEFRELRIGVSEKKRIKEKYHLPERFFIYVGDVNWNKNVPNIVRATKKAGVNLVLVGKVFAQERFDRSNPWNRDLAQVLGLIEGEKGILRLGFVPEEDLILLYNLATALVFPSYYEGFGFPVLEAMACGCPVITSDRGSLREVGDGSVLCVNPESFKEISEAILKVQKDKELQNHLSFRGIEEAKNFSIKRTLGETVEVYRKVLKENEK